MRYAKNVPYLIPAIFYLGTNEGWWARSPGGMAEELSLDQKRLAKVLNGFPAVFRRSRFTDEASGQNYFALQARYAKRSGGAIDEGERVIDVPPLSVEHLKLVTDFVLQSAEAERVVWRIGLTSLISLLAAVLAAYAAITAASLKSPPERPIIAAAPPLR